VISIKLPNRDVCVLTRIGKRSERTLCKVAVGAYLLREVLPGSTSNVCSC